MKEETEKPEEEEHEKKPEREPKDVAITDIELEELKKDAEGYKHKYLHLLADAENARKRLQKDRSDIIQYAIQNIILDFLHPIDHMENALGFTEEASDEVKHWATGFQMILNQFKDVLVNNGVKTFEALGKDFDPHLHDAVEMIETNEHPPGTVVEESVRGYAIGEKTLRPARVKVSKAPAKEKQEEQPEEQKS
ncbi:MAG: Protein GrpE [Chlamydiae bacterium]|nr:Protein GrpE [Chlamydiota bacterium]